MSTVYVGIGSNLGERQGNCFCAIDLLEKKGIIIKNKSSIYETEPWGVKDQPPFLNMVIKVETDLQPSQLLEVLKTVEKEVGREESYKWGPRVIDLDILLFDDIVVQEDSLTIPHPLMHERDFVLRPLLEIAPDVIHPVLKMSIGQLFCRLTGVRSRIHGNS